MDSESLVVVIAGRRASSLATDMQQDRVELRIAHTDEELRQAARGAHVLYSWRIPDGVPKETPSLRWVQLPSAGVDHVRDLPIWHSDITITASQGIHTVPMTEHLFGMMLALIRQLNELVRAQEQSAWRHDTQQAHLRLGELHGKTLGIIGWGKIGEGAAHLARAFGMRVIGTRWSVMVPREVPRPPHLSYTDPPWVEPLDMLPDIIYPAAQLHEVLAQSDMVVTFLPLTAETHGTFGDSEFRSMKRGALFFNLGRGAVVNEDALMRALQGGRIGGAGLDVFSAEPLPRSSPLWTMPNVIISPHVGGVSDRTTDRANRLFTVNLSRFLEGQPLLNVVHRDRGY